MNVDKRTCWHEALMLPQQNDLLHSLVTELSEYTGLDPEHVEAQCAQSLKSSAQAWQTQSRNDETSILKFYDEYADYIFEEASLNNLHRRLESCFEVLKDIRAHGGKTLVDYGSGIGSTALFFQAQGFQLSLADVSTPMLDFCRWRFAKRQLKANVIDLKTEHLPENAFDFIVCFDVFEHLRKPYGHLKALNRAMKTKGLLFIEACFGEDPERPMHIVRDSRVLDLAPFLGLEVMNCSSYRLLIQPSLLVFRSGQAWGVSRLLAFCMGILRYCLKAVKNG